MSVQPTHSNELSIYTSGLTNSKSVNTTMRLTDSTSNIRPYKIDYFFLTRLFLEYLDDAGFLFYFY